MAELQVALVSPEREVWSGRGEMVVAKTLDGDVGIMAGHAPLLGTLVEGGVVRIRRQGEQELAAAVHGGFISMSEDQVSVLAEHAELGDEVDPEAARSALETALATIDQEGAESEASLQRARLRAAGYEA